MSRKTQELNWILDLVLKMNENNYCFRLTLCVMAEFVLFSYALVLSFDHFLTEIKSLDVFNWSSRGEMLKR